ncbi:MAG: helix-turn-helix domain-containing protein [Phycisphaerae bacterium]|jgi:uncharacterized protein YaaW (UPF0174 family)
MTDKHSPTGSAFDEFLRDEGIYEKTCVAAAKKNLSLQIAEEMKVQNISKTQMAEKMHTSRSALNRLLDPSCGSVTLQTLDKAARCLGRQLHITLT